MKIELSPINIPGEEIRPLVDNEKFPKKLLLKLLTVLVFI